MQTNDKAVIITGAAGFVGYYLTKALSDKGYCVYSIVRSGSNSNSRIKNLPGVRLIETDLATMNVKDLALQVDKKCDCLYHLAWMAADRYNYPGQMEGAYLAVKMLRIASELGCKRFVGIGSQAEYGVTEEVMSEDDLSPKPFCGYGSAKVAACYLTRKIASDLGIEWTWGRIFSIYGKYEPQSRLIPTLIKSFQRNDQINLSSCRQNWDFLHGEDAANALMAMGEKGRNGEVYNIANGGYRPLKDFVEELKEICNSSSSIVYGNDPNPFVSLQPSVLKIQNDIGWEPKISFYEGIKKIMEDMV